jgi:Ca2+-binding EF-hand superfamily protein
MGGMGGGMAGMGPMGPMGGMTPEAMQQARMQRIQAMLQGIDTNHNGTIEPEEAQGPNAFMLDRILRNAGVEPKYPLPISKIQEAMNNQFKLQNGQATPSSTPDKTKEEAKPADSAGAALVPGFGEVSLKLTPVPGFGVAIPATTDSAKKSNATGDSTSTSSASTPSAPPLDDRIRQYASQHAKDLMKDYDKNGNGRLEKEEWSQMKEKYKAADKDGDGIITMDELTAFLIADSGSGYSSSSGTAVASNAMGNSAAAPGNSSKPKFHPPTPTERLPKDIPSWYISADYDSDGTVSMAEFIKAKGDTEAAAKEFAQYDLNNDGVITPQEALRAAKKK